MTCHRRFYGARCSSQGFSLIELMISLAIGLVILAAAFSAYLGASGATRMAEAQSRMNEDAQAALTILTRQLRMAGNNPKQPNRDATCQRNPVYNPNIFPGLPCLDEAIVSTGVGNATTKISGLSGTGAFMVNGCDGPFADPPSSSVSGIDTLSCKTTTSTLPDSIAISYEADRYNTVPTASPDFKPTDCLGQSIGSKTFTFAYGSTTAKSTASSAITVADNQFYIGTSTVILSPSLYCKGNGGPTPQPLVENIEDMQFRYGLVDRSPVSPTTPVTTAQVTGYLTAGEFSSNMTGLSDAARWAKVITVRICVLVRSESPVAIDINSAKYRNCEDALVSAPDLRLRRAYSTTVVLRNQRLNELPTTPTP